MKALVVYESMWGNTEQIARAIAAGLAEHVDVEVVDVNSAPHAPGEEVRLVVAGGPTHALSMTRQSTRADAIKQGAQHSTQDIGLRDWLDALPSGHHATRLATFDTKVDKARHLPGSAAKSAARSGRRHGYQAATHAESFYVHGTDGPLLAGELDRANSWGRQLAADLAQPST